MKEPWDAIFWWELRRIPFNLLLLIGGMVSLMCVYAAGQHLLGKLVAPFIIVVGTVGYAIAANAFYTLGWVSELLWSGGAKLRTAEYRNHTFYIGLAGSVTLTLIPALLFGLGWVLLRHQQTIPPPRRPPPLDSFRLDVLEAIFASEVGLDQDDPRSDRSTKKLTRGPHPEPFSLLREKVAREARRMRGRTGLSG